MAEGMIQINMRDIPAELWHRAKMQALSERITLKDLLVRALTAELERCHTPPSPAIPAPADK